MRADTRAAIAERIADSKGSRERARAAASTGRWDEAEDDRTRATAYDARVARLLGLPEAVRGSNDFQPAAFLPDGATARRAVARVLVDTATESRMGTGFLISPDLFLTNQHVITDAADANNTVVVFDDELTRAGEPAGRSIFKLLPERLALFSDERVLDYAVVAIGDRIEGKAALVELGYCALNFTPDRHRLGMNVDIIQHPNGMPKTIAVRNNLLTNRDETHLLYETDTDVGSSGSPVFNDQWDLVALHHYGGPSTPQPPGEKASNNVNEGIRISAIYQDLQHRATSLEGVAQELVQRALTLWRDTAPTSKQLERRSLSPRPLEARTSVEPPTASGGSSDRAKASQTLTIPLEIEVRVGQQGMGDGTLRAPTATPPAATRALSRTPEVSKLDTDYSDRNGFDPDFVPGVRLDLARIVKTKKSVIAGLRDGTPQAASGQLKYQNFSVIMHKGRRFAVLTATNIDGLTYVSINRKTGEPAATQPEGETWYRDPRIEPTAFVDQDFYTAWSHLFDRGHLTRRDDPTWGNFATRANWDTFHFTNCTPQHWQFNESIKFWQGIERYVLEQGLFISGRNRPIAVLQGPVLDDANDQWADQVQVPSEFWKLVVWNGKTGLKAVALIADQRNLFSIPRKGGVKPAAVDTAVNVTEYQSSVETIEHKTGLDLAAVRPYDTAGKDLPTVGEAVRVLKRWEDLRLE